MFDQVKVRFLETGIRVLVMLAPSVVAGPVRLVFTSVASAVVFNSVRVMRPAPPAGPGSLSVIAKLGERLTLPPVSLICTNPRCAVGFSVALLTLAETLRGSPVLGA